MFEVSVLASGSSGNCFYIGSDKANILIDAGISCKQISERLKGIGRDIKNINGIFLSHEHIDHIRGIDTLTRKYDIPVFVNKGTLGRCYFDMGGIQLFKTNEPMDFNGLKIIPFSKNHDATDPVSFIVKNGAKKISVMTDAGICCPNMERAASESDVMILEANHDSEMLKNGQYPYYLKKRIASTRGHLSNRDAALLVLEHAKKKLKHVLLSHLSLFNNTPELAMNTFKTIIGERSDLNGLKTWLTYREKPTPLISVP